MSATRLQRWQAAMTWARMATDARGVSRSPATNRVAKDRAIETYTRATDALVDHLVVMREAGDLERIEALLREGL